MSVQVKNMKYRKLSTKIILAVIAILLFSAAISMYYQEIVIKKSLLAEEINRSRELTVFCEQTRIFLSKLRGLGVFDDEKMMAELETDLAENKTYSDTKIFLTIPVVAAWTAAEAKARELGYQFRIPKNNPRNMKNEPRPGLEKAVVDYLEGRGSISEIEKTGAVILYPEDKTRANQIGEIGVLYQGVEKLNAHEKNGQRSVDAVRFFKSIRLTQDCMVCHGEPKGRTDFLGFKKEGWKTGEIHGAFEISLPLAPMREKLVSARMNNIIISLIIFILAALLFNYFINKLIRKPLEKIADYIQKIGNGDFSGQLEIESRDEIGEMSGHLNTATANIRQTIKRLTDIAGSLAYSSSELTLVSDKMSSSAGELSSQSSMVAAATEQISTSIATVASSAGQSSGGADNIAAMAEEMSSTVREIATLAEQTSNKVKAMADASEHMAGSVNNVASAIEEMTTSLNEVTKNTDMANRIAQNARESADRIDSRMEVLSMASREIGKIVGVIKDIADQTNMLALNATIEAAGAGDAGKGFAVVAGEVKDLARQSGEASGEIANRIENIQTSIQDAITAIHAINKVISESADINQTIAASVSEQTMTASEISRNVADSAGMAHDVSELSSEASSLVADIAKATGENSKAAINVARHTSEISKAVNEVSKAAAETSAGSNEIARNIQGVNTAAREMAVSAAITSKSAEDLSNKSKQLSEVIRSFNAGKEKFDITSVKAAHISWRLKLEQVPHGVLAMHSSEITSDHECEFGKWYFGPEGQKFKHEPVFEDIGTYHHEVHDLAMKILELHENEESQHARNMMEKFEVSRVRLFEALEKLYIG
jgi:methyl-accepting chemotaxis protein